MARRPARPARRARQTSNGRPPRESTPPATEREKIIAAFLTLLGETSIDRISLAEIARSAGVTLAQLRGEFGSPLAILAAYLKNVDRAVLSEDFSDMEEEPPRERLFDVLMRRLEKMVPHRQAIRSLMRSARGNPLLTLALNRLAVRSQKWMLAAAGIGGSGPRGALRAQGLAVLFSSVLRTWVRDDDPGLAGTMAALDRALARGQRFAGFLNDLFFITSRLCRLRPRRRRRDNDEEEAVAA
jgi:AcrR family transcriptional regulator